jgi:hypothetical protein
MKTWHYVDKKDWKQGPWQQEPDKAHWVYKGLDCLIVRGPSGALCGYVGVPKSHPFYGKGYDEVQNSYDSEGNERQPLANIDVHGGLTFSDPCREAEDGYGICHPKEGAANEDVHWFGFDCAHSVDLCPAHERFYTSSRFETYRDLKYVKAEVESLADQLLKYGESNEPRT